MLDGTGFKPMRGVGEKGAYGNAIIARFYKADIVPSCLEPRRDSGPDLQERDACSRFYRADMRQMGMARKHDISTCGDQIVQNRGGVMHVGRGAIGGWHRGVMHHGDTHETGGRIAERPPQGLCRNAAPSHAECPHRAAVDALSRLSNPMSPSPPRQNQG
jgi:hypothetical protein